MGLLGDYRRDEANIHRIQRDLEWKGYHSDVARRTAKALWDEQKRAEVEIALAKVTEGPLKPFLYNFWGLVQRITGRKRG